MPQPQTRAAFLILHRGPASSSSLKKLARFINLSQKLPSSAFQLPQRQWLDTFVQRVTVRAGIEHPDTLRCRWQSEPSAPCQYIFDYDRFLSSTAGRHDYPVPLYRKIQSDVISLARHQPTEPVAALLLSQFFCLTTSRLPNILPATLDSSRIDLGSPGSPVTDRRSAMGSGSRPSPMGFDFLGAWSTPGC
jgi:hypothetical protein